MDFLINWIKLNPHIVTIILLVGVLVIAIKAIKKIVIPGIIAFLIIGVVVFNGSIFPSADQARDMINKITSEGTNYIQSKEYQEDLKLLKDKYPELVDIVEEKTNEILGE